MRRHSFMRATVVLLTTFALAACGDDDDDCDGPTCPGNENGIGSMSATITGDVSESLSGGAFYSEDPESDAWGVFMGNEDDEEGSAIWLFGESGRPGTGTHDLTGENSSFYVHGASQDVFFVESGEMVITTSNSERVAGSFEFIATDADGDEVNVEGTFNAPNIDAL